MIGFFKINNDRHHSIKALKFEKQKNPTRLDDIIIYYNCKAKE